MKLQVIVIMSSNVADCNSVMFPTASIAISNFPCLMTITSFSKMDHDQDNVESNIFLRRFVWCSRFYHWELWISIYYSKSYLHALVHLQTSKPFRRIDPLILFLHFSGAGSLVILKFLWPLSQIKASNII